MDKFTHLSEVERDVLKQALIKECLYYINYGLNGFNKSDLHDYNAALYLLKGLDFVDKKYEYRYKDWYFKKC